MVPRCAMDDHHTIIFTEKAATKVWELIQEEGNFKLKLRVYITGGGCSGFQYGFTFDEHIQTDDTIITRSIPLASNRNKHDDDNKDDSSTTMVQLLVDSMSFQYLIGAEIDYKENIEGEQFIIRNPNA